MKRRSYRRTLIRLSRMALMVPLLWQLSAQAQESTTHDMNDRRRALHDRHAEELAELREENPALAAELDQLRAEREQRQAAFAEKYPEITKMMTERRAAAVEHRAGWRGLRGEGPGGWRGEGRGMRGWRSADSDEG